MNLRNECPQVSDSWRGGVLDTCRVLGEEGRPLNPKTLAKYVKLGRANGGLDCVKSRSGSTKRKMVFTGKEIKRFWRSY